MNHSKGKLNVLSITVMVLLLGLAIPATSLAQGRGHGRGRSSARILSLHDRKCAKFVNCHDASEGRWDGRGPRSDRVGNIILRNRIRHRNGRFDDNDNFVLRNLRRNRNRNFDNDEFIRNRRFMDRNRDFGNDGDHRGQGRHGKHE